MAQSIIKLLPAMLVSHIGGAGHCCSASVQLPAAVPGKTMEEGPSGQSSCSGFLLDSHVADVSTWR